MKYAILLLALLTACTSTPKKILSAHQYQNALTNHIERRLNAPKDLYPTYDCTFYLQQNKAGVITATKVDDCDASSQLKAIFEQTIAASSPLPLPDNAELYDSELVFRFCRGCERPQ